MEGPQTTRPFLLNDERGGFMAWELWQLAKCCGKTPWDLVHDKHFGFNLTVLRAARKFKMTRLAMAAQAGDGLGAALQSLVEEV